MRNLILSPLPAMDEPVEIVERKGLGHPDTICDALAEDFSRNLSLEYRRRFGRILHHNVDKVLLCGGRSAPAFKGGVILSPIDIYLAGRVTATAGGIDLPIDDIAVEGAREWLRSNLHALNAARDVRIHCVAQPGSQDLRDLFGRNESALANDTSYGVAHAPLSKLESLVLRLEKRLNERDRVNDHPAWGEDIKIMGVRRGLAVELTIGCAMIGGHLSGVAEYLEEKAAVEEVALGLAHEHGFAPAVVQVNMADDTSSGSVFLTVGGTSAEAGDDGEVGRGNRANGLITPGRAMSLEAVAGKNPVSHVGKVYNVIAQRIVENLVSAQPDIAGAECLLVSRIGRPVSEPALVQVKIAARDGASSAEIFRERVAAIVTGFLSRTAELVEEFVRGGVSQFRKVGTAVGPALRFVPECYRPLFGPLGKLDFELDCVPVYTLKGKISAEAYCVGDHHAFELLCGSADVTEAFDASRNFSVRYAIEGLCVEQSDDNVAIPSASWAAMHRSFRMLAGVPPNDRRRHDTEIGCDPIHSLLIVEHICPSATDRAYQHSQEK